MNKKQIACLGVGILAIATIWAYQSFYAKDFDLVFLIIVSVLASMLVAGLWLHLRTTKVTDRYH